MGCFSWDCKWCGKSLLGPCSDEDPLAWMNSAVVLLENGSILKGSYDGYGRINDGLEADLSDIDGQFACYHSACYEKAGKPGYDGPSRSSHDQGYFIDEEAYPKQPPESCQYGEPPSDHSILDW